jgi:DNA-binding transcriptional MerR regulator
MPQATLEESDDDLITVSTAAKIHDCPESTFRSLVTRGLIWRAARTPSGISLYRRGDVKRLASRRAGLK